MKPRSKKANMKLCARSTRPAKKVWSPCAVVLFFSAVQCDSLHCESAAACWTLSQLNYVWVYNMPKPGGGEKKQWRGWTAKLIGWSHSVMLYTEAEEWESKGKRKGGWEITIQKPCLILAFSVFPAAILPTGNGIINISQRNRPYERYGFIDIRILFSRPTILNKLKFCEKVSKRWNSMWEHRWAHSVAD